MNDLNKTDSTPTHVDKTPDSGNERWTAQIHRWHWLISIILSAILSIVVSWHTGRKSADERLSEDLMQGQILANIIGYRYFQAFVGTTVNENNRRVFEINKKSSYITVLREMGYQIQKMSTIPYFVKNYENISDLATVQNALVHELALQSDEKIDAPSGTLLARMCDLYIGEGKFWSKNATLPEEDESLRAMISGAEQICSQLQNKH